MPVTCTHRRQHISTSKRRNSVKTANSNSTKIIVVRDEFAPAPNKRRRFNANQIVTEEEARHLLQQQQNQSEQQPIWDLLKSSYTLLMEDGGIVDKCGSLDAQLAEPASDEDFTLVEFYKLWKEHNDWLRQLQLRLQRPAASKAERYLVQLDAESDQRAHLSAQKKVSHYASALCLANPRVADDVSAKMRSLQEAWLAVEAALELWIGSGGSLLDDLDSDLQETEAWLATANENRLQIPANMNLLTQEQKTAFLNAVKTREDEIQARLKAMDAVTKVLERLTDDCEPDDRVTQLLSAAQRLRSQFFEFLLQLMEIKISLEDDFQQAGRSLCGFASEAAAAAAAPALAVPSSWGAESGFVSELSPTAGLGNGNRTLTAIGAAISTADSYDVLPFSEDEYEKISSSQSSEPMFALDDLADQPHWRGRSKPQSAADYHQTLRIRRRRPICDSNARGDETHQRHQLKHQSRCYYRVMTVADSDASDQADVGSSPMTATAATANASAATSATPGRGDDQIVEDDSCSSGGGGGGGFGQKRRLTRSSSPLAVVTRELYVDAGALLLGGANQQPMARAASLGAIGVASGALSLAMAMETAGSETGLAVELPDVEVGYSDLTSADSTDGSLADESSSIGHSSSPPSPLPAPAPTPTGAMPPALSASATATISYSRQRGRPAGTPRRRTSRDGLPFAGQQQKQALLQARRSEQRHRLMDAKRLASRAERYFTRSAGHLCVSAVGFISQEDQSVLVTGSNETLVSAAVTSVIPSASEPGRLANMRPKLELAAVYHCAGQEGDADAALNGQEDLDQLWDHYQPQPYAVGADEAAEERLDDSHLQWEADQQHFDACQDQQPAHERRQQQQQFDARNQEAATVSAASASALTSESESDCSAAMSSDSELLLAEELRRASAVCLTIDDSEAALTEEAARLLQLANAARMRRDQIELSVRSADDDDDDDDDDEASNRRQQQRRHRRRRGHQAAGWDRLADGFARLSEAGAALAEIGVQLADLRAAAEAAESRLRSVANGASGGQLADRVLLLRDTEAALHGWLGQLVGLHSRLQSACGNAEAALSGAAMPLPSWLAQIRQYRGDQIVMLSRWLGSMREGCGSRLFSLLRTQEQLQQAESAVLKVECALADEERNFRQCEAELADFNPLTAPGLRVSQLDLLRAQLQSCIDRCPPDAAGQWLHLLVQDSDLSDEDVGELKDRLSKADSRYSWLLGESSRLLNLINQLKFEFHNLQSSPSTSEESESATPAAPAPVRVAHCSKFVYCCLFGLVILLLALTRAGLFDLQIVGITQPYGAPY